jgi:hypothetical protein
LILRILHFVIKHYTRVYHTAHTLSINTNNKLRIHRDGSATLSGKWWEWEKTNRREWLLGRWVGENLYSFFPDLIGWKN